MKDNKLFENIPVKMADLSLSPQDQGDVRDNDSMISSIRFFQAAANLLEDEMIGLELSADAEVSTEDEIMIRAAVFAGIESDVTEDDLNWIFKNSGTTRKIMSSHISNVLENGRHAYALVPRIAEDADEQADNRSIGDAEWEKCVSDFIKVIAQNGGVIRIIAWSSHDHANAASMFLISMPDKMSLKMRTLASMAFRGMTLKEISEQTGMIEEIETGDKDLAVDGMSGILRVLMFEELLKEFRRDHDDMFGHEIFGVVTLDALEEQPEEDNTPIEELRLSIRSCNCLKRAGISTVGELSLLSNDELLKIRNLGKKCVNEIKLKLEQFSKESGKAIGTGMAPAAIKRNNEEEAEEETGENATDNDQCEDKISFSSQLDELIGLEEVKRQVRRIAAFAKLQQDMTADGKTSEPVVLNMEFVGNPGTAKTTVARIMAGILHETGIMKRADMIEVGRADLVGSYAGETATKVKKVFEKAKGAMLFIDEAYSLIDAWENAHGDEAINTIVQEIENNRADTIVVFAGYPDKMKEFFSRNPGLRSRVPFSIRFKDYTADEMVQIVELEAERRGFSVDSAVRTKLAEALRTIDGRSQKGNGRFCRNLVESAILEYASRVYCGSDDFTVNNYVLTDKDFGSAIDPGNTGQEDRNTAESVAARRRIGFTA